MQQGLAVIVLPRQPEVVLDRADRPHGRTAERLVVALPHDCRGGRARLRLHGPQMIDVVVVDLLVVVDPRQRSSVLPDVGLAVAGLVLFIQQFAIGPIVEGGGQPVLVDLLDALAEGVVGVGGGFGGSLAEDEAVIAVVGEASGACALGVAVGGLWLRLGALLFLFVGWAVGV